ncbi:hypothetical protein [Tenuifilum sp.]|uniref:hypothetical protein n=1 Tax=Tenuifilum sp. TaxID=2760880 RepID=UPI00403E5237
MDGKCMEQKQENFKEKLEFGQDGEHEVALVLLDMGVSVLPLYQFDSDHAPYILGAGKRLISPDLFCFGNKSFMVEVKTKNQWVEFRGVVETGIEQKHYNHYKQVQEMTGLDVFLFFNHKEKQPIGLYFCKLDEYTRVWDGSAKGKQVHPPMVFYNIEVLKKVL